MKPQLVADVVADADDALPVATPGPQPMRPPREPYASRPRNAPKTSRVAKAGKNRRRG